MEDVFLKIQKMVYKFISMKNKYYYRILYLLSVCRILLYLYNDKTYGHYSYKLFYNKIFPVLEIDKYFTSNYYKEQYKPNSKIGVIIEEEHFSIKEKSNDSEEDKKVNSNIFFDLNNFPDEMHPVKLDNSQNMEISENNEEEKKQNIDEILSESSNDNNERLIDEFPEWYDESEIEILSFYVSFLLIYSLYLNEKNSMIKDINEENKDDEPALSSELSLYIFFKKIKNSLSPQYKKARNHLQQLNNNNNFSTTNITLNNITNNTTVNNLTKSTNAINTSLNPSIASSKKDENFLLDFKGLEVNSTFESDDDFIIEKAEIDPQYLFIFALFQAIINFKNSSVNNSIEIPIKQYFAKKNEYEESESEDITQKENELLYDKNAKNNNILFYYYESSYIDIILLEKILIEIALKSSVKNYCLELADNNEIKPDLLQELLKNLNFYKMMQNYRIKEYNLINNLFVKNNFTLLIKKILTLFKYDDLKEIPQMDNFMFKKMGEIYSQEEIKPNEETEQKNWGLVEFFQFND